MRFAALIIVSAFAFVLQLSLPLEGGEVLYRTPIYAKGSGMRNYNAVLLPQEQKEIAHVIETLGNSSLVSLAKSKSSIERSGKQIEHVHTLRFLAYIFSVEKLKASFHNLRKRSWVWGKFYKGLQSGLDEEYDRNNLLPFMDDFSRRVGMDVNILYPLVAGRKWKEFVDALLAGIPRSENSGRYDM